METYHVSCKKYTENENSSVRKTTQSRLCFYQIVPFVARKNQHLLKIKKLTVFEMNNIINNFLLTGDKFMPELHLKQPGFTYKACGPFTKHRERIQKFRETGNLKHLYRNKLEKACFALDATYSDSKDLAKRTVSDTSLEK